MSKRPDPIVGPRHIVVATRCKLLTGCYPGKTKDCPCVFTQNCRLTEEQRKVLAQFPIIQRRVATNRLEHDSLQ